MTQIRMKVLRKKGTDVLVFKQVQGGKLVMSASRRSPFIKPLKLKEGQIVTITIKK